MIDPTQNSSIKTPKTALETIRIVQFIASTAIFIGLLGLTIYFDYFYQKTPNLPVKKVQTEKTIEYKQLTEPEITKGMRQKYKDIYAIYPEEFNTILNKYKNIFGKDAENLIKKSQNFENQDLVNGGASSMFLRQLIRTATFEEELTLKNNLSSTQDDILTKKYLGNILESRGTIFHSEVQSTINPNFGPGTSNSFVIGNLTNARELYKKDVKISKAAKNDTMTIVYKIDELVTKGYNDDGLYIKARADLIDPKPDNFSTINFNLNRRFNADTQTKSSDVLSMQNPSREQMYGYDSSGDRILACKDKIYASYDCTQAMYSLSDFNIIDSIGRQQEEFLSLYFNINRPLKLIKQENGKLYFRFDFDKSSDLALAMLLKNNQNQLLDKNPYNNIYTVDSQNFNLLSVENFSNDTFVWKTEIIKQREKNTQPPSEVFQLDDDLVRYCVLDQTYEQTKSNTPQIPCIGRDDKQEISNPIAVSSTQNSKTKSSLIKFWNYSAGTDLSGKNREVIIYLSPDYGYDDPNEFEYFKQMIARDKQANFTLKYVTNSSEESQNRSLSRYHIAAKLQGDNEFLDVAAFTQLARNNKLRFISEQEKAQIIDDSVNSKLNVGKLDKQRFLDDIDGIAKVYLKEDVNELTSLNLPASKYILSDYTPPSNYTPSGKENLVLVFENGELKYWWNANRTNEFIEKAMNIALGPNT